MVAVKIPPPTSRPMQTAEPNRKLVLMLSKLNSHISQLCTSLLSG